MTKTGSTTTSPRLGATVLYTLNQADVDEIVRRRDSRGKLSNSNFHPLNIPRDGDTYPAVIVRDFAQTDEEIHTAAKNFTERAAALRPGRDVDRENADYDDATNRLHAHRRDATVNLVVWLDGLEQHWATSRSEFDPEKHTSHRGLTVEDGKVAERNGEPDPRGHWQYRPQDRPLRFATGGHVSGGYIGDRSRGEVPVMLSPGSASFNVPREALADSSVLHDAIMRLNQRAVNTPPAISDHEKRRLQQDGLRP